MRYYPPNSPEAAARLLALTMIADGDVCRAEVEALERLDVEASLGLPSGVLGAVLRDLREDLRQAATEDLGGGVDDALLDTLVCDVDDPALQRQLFTAVSVAAAADGFLADGELRVLDAMHRWWPTSITAMANVRRLS